MPTPTPITEPALMTEEQAFEIFEQHPLSGHQPPFLESFARYAVHSIFMMASRCLEGVKILRMSDTSPALFQVRSTKNVRQM